MQSPPQDCLTWGTTCRSHGHLREAGAEEQAQGGRDVAQPEIARTCSSSLLHQLPHRSRSGVGYEGSAEPPSGQPDARRAASQHTNGPGQNYSTAAATSPKVHYDAQLYFHISLVPGYGSYGGHGLPQTNPQLKSAAGANPSNTALGCHPSPFAGRLFGCDVFPFIADLRQQPSPTCLFGSWVSDRALLHHHHCHLDFVMIEHRPGSGGRSRMAKKMLCRLIDWRSQLPCL